MSSVVRVTFALAAVVGTVAPSSAQWGRPQQTGSFGFQITPPQGNRPAGFSLNLGGPNGNFNLSTGGGRPFSMNINPSNSGRPQVQNQTIYDSTTGRTYQKSTIVPGTSYNMQNSSGTLFNPSVSNGGLFGGNSNPRPVYGAPGGSSTFNPSSSSGTVFRSGYDTTPYSYQGSAYNPSSSLPVVYGGATRPNTYYQPSTTYIPSTSSYPPTTWSQPTQATPVNVTSTPVQPQATQWYPTMPPVTGSTCNPQSSYPQSSGSSPCSPPPPPSADREYNERFVAFKNKTPYTLIVRFQYLTHGGGQTVWQPSDCRWMRYEIEPGQTQYAMLGPYKLSAERIRYYAVTLDGRKGIYKHKNKPIVLGFPHETASGRLTYRADHMGKFTFNLGG